MTGSDRIWPVGGYAPGLYMCKCSTCGKTHHADKRAWQCADCVIQRLRDPAVLAALPEVQALIAEAYEVAAKFLTDTVAEWSCGHDARHCDCWRDKEQWSLAAEAVEGLTPADATAALAARDAAMRAEGLREAATLLREQGYGTAPKQILARAAGIEKDGK